MDGTPHPAAETAFKAHLRARGKGIGLTLENPELLRLARVIGCSVGHLYKVATEQRQPSLTLANAIVRNTTRNKAITLATFGYVQAPATARRARRAPARAGERVAAG